ncbi:MAG: type II toxin-antitoxin system HicB family antitoxin [Chloroflexi bacterium]|nr:type II toxin-antitoxin system HicB family antitoxin [Chloroflexota bacterium]
MRSQSETLAHASERAYTVRLTQEPGVGFAVEVPALPEVATYGATREEAIESAREAITLWIDDLEARGLPVPEDAEAATTYVIRIAA